MQKMYLNSYLFLKKKKNNMKESHSFFMKWTKIQLTNVKLVHGIKIFKIKHQVP